MALLLAAALCVVLAAPSAVATPGAQLWVSRYNGAANGYDAATATGVSPDGSTVFVTGGSDESEFNSDYATVALSASTGKSLWAQRYDGPAGGDDAATAIAVSPDGSNVFVTGGSEGSTTAEDYATVAYDATTGTQLWAKRYNGRSNGQDAATAV